MLYINSLPISPCLFKFLILKNKNKKLIFTLILLLVSIIWKAAEIGPKFAACGYSFA